MHDRVTMTRDELYRLVWEKPMSRLAAEYSISDVGLKKLCARHNIPTPPRGYWAQREAGRAPSRPKLPPSKDAPPIHLRVWSPDEHEAKVQDELSTAIAQAKRPENQVSVAERLQAPCDLVREATSALKAAEPDTVGILKCPPQCLDIRVSRAQLPRALRIADALLKAFARRNWEVAIRRDGTFVVVNEVPIALTIEEIVETIEIPAKPDLSTSYSFHYNRRETEQRPSGHLSVGIREPEHLWNHSQQRNWRGSEKRAVETRLTDVIVGMLRLAAAVGADLAEKERRKLEEQERQRKREAALDEQKRLRKALAQEKANLDLLLEQAGRWRESQAVRLFVEEARKHGGVPELGLEGEALEQWIVWATQQADRLDPFAPSPRSILDDADRIEHMCDGLHPWR